MKVLFTKISYAFRKLFSLFWHLVQYYVSTKQKEKDESNKED